MNKVFNFHTLTDSLKLNLLIKGVSTDETVKPIQKTIGVWEEIFGNEKLKHSIIRTTQLYTRQFVVDTKYPNESVLSSIAELAEKRQANLPKDKLRVVTINQGLEPEFVLGLIVQAAAKAHSVELYRVEEENKKPGAIKKLEPAVTIEGSVNKLYKMVNYVLRQAKSKVDVFENKAKEIRNKNMIPTVELYEPMSDLIRPRIEKMVAQEFGEMKEDPGVLKSAIKEAANAAKKINIY